MLSWGDRRRRGRGAGEGEATQLFALVSASPKHPQLLCESELRMHPQLLYESKLYKILSGGVGIPNLHW